MKPNANSQGPQRITVEHSLLAQSVAIMVVKGLVQRLRAWLLSCDCDQSPRVETLVNVGCAILLSPLPALSPSSEKIHFKAVILF